MAHVYGNTEDSTTKGASAREPEDRAIAEKVAEVERYENLARDFGGGWDRALARGYREKAAEAREELEVMKAAAAEKSLTPVDRFRTEVEKRLRDCTGRANETAAAPHAAERASHERLAAYYERMARHADRSTAAGYREKAAEERAAAREQFLKGARR